MYPNCVDCGKPFKVDTPFMDDNRRIFIEGEGPFCSECASKRRKNT